MQIDNWWLLPMGFVFDFIYIGWYWACEKNKALLGGLASVAIVGVGLTGVFEAIDNKWNLIPYMLGLFLGSYVGIKLKNRNGKNGSNGA